MQVKSSEDYLTHRHLINSLEDLEVQWDIHSSDNFQQCFPKWGQSLQVHLSMLPKGLRCTLKVQAYQLAKRS